MLWTKSGKSTSGESGSIIVNFCYLEVVPWLSVDEGWWGGVESLILIFILCFTQVNEDKVSV